ncbi:MAG: hypothetical protein H2042_06190 [Rhizobiales bacterium]|nr:hypothetical protein [Hyphomicrobiales bacterium]
MKRALLALSLLAVSAGTAFAQVKMTWDASETDNGGVLTFGVPESDNSMLSFVCNKGNANVLISSHIGSKGLKADEAARIILTAGKVKKEFPGKAVASPESSAIDVEGGGKLADLKAVLTAGKAMSLEVKGAKQQVSLDGAPEAYAQFEAACQ